MIKIIYKVKTVEPECIRTICPHCHHEDRHPYYLEKINRMLWCTKCRKTFRVDSVIDLDKETPKVEAAVPAKTQVASSIRLSVYNPDGLFIRKKFRQEKEKKPY